MVGMVISLFSLISVMDDMEEWGYDIQSCRIYSQEDAATGEIRDIHEQNGYM